MIKLQDIKTPKTIEEFRNNLKKFCLGSKGILFIYYRDTKKKYDIEIKGLSKISDAFNQIDKGSITAKDFDIILMFDYTHLNFLSINNIDYNTIEELKKINVFNNDNVDERKNFLFSSKGARDNITTGKKITEETIFSLINYSAMDMTILGNIYLHLFGTFYDIVGFIKKINLSRIN